MTIQMPLNIAWNDEPTLLNFYPTGNEIVLQTLQRTASGRGEKLIYLWGGQGTGRTHLLQGCCHKARQIGLNTFYLSFKDIAQLKPDVLEKLEMFHLICFDNLEVIAADFLWEEHVFDCFNRIQEASKRLIIASHVPPRSIEPPTP